MTKIQEPKTIDVDFKVNFIKLLSSMMKRLPPAQQPPFARIIARIKNPDIVMTSEDKQTAAILLAYLFCGKNIANFPMNDENKTSVETFSDKHLRDLAVKPGPSKAR